MLIGSSHDRDVRTDNTDRSSRDSSIGTIAATVKSVGADRAPASPSYVRGALGDRQRIHSSGRVAALLARGPDYIPDHAEAEQALLQAVGDGDAVRVALGQDALWTASSSVGSTLPEHAAGRLVAATSR